MYKVFVKFPDALRPAFPRLKDRLEDPDPGEFIVATITRHVASKPHYADWMTIITHFQNASCCYGVRQFCSQTPLQKRAAVPILAKPIRRAGFRVWGGAPVVTIITDYMFVQHLDDPYQSYTSS